MDESETKRLLTEFITANSGTYFEVGIQMNFTFVPAGTMRRLLHELINEHSIRKSKEGRHYAYE